MADSKPNPENKTRCYHCAGPLFKDMETSHWTVAPLIRDSFSMIGSAVGGTTSAFYGFNHVMPKVQRWVKGPMWLHFFIGAPPVIVFSSACAGLAGGAVPALAQLASSSYHSVGFFSFVNSSFTGCKQAKGQRFFSLVSATVPCICAVHIYALGRQGRLGTI